MEVRDLLGLIRVVRDPDGDDVLVGEQVDEVGSQRSGQRTVQGGEKGSSTRSRLGSVDSARAMATR